MGQVLSEIDVLGSNLVDDSSRTINVKHSEVNTLDTIRGEDHALYIFCSPYINSPVLKSGNMV